MAARPAWENDEYVPEVMPPVAVVPQAKPPRQTQPFEREAEFRALARFPGDIRRIRELGTLGSAAKDALGQKMPANVEAKYMLPFLGVRQPAYQQTVPMVLKELHKEKNKEWRALRKENARRKNAEARERRRTQRLAHEEEVAREKEAVAVTEAWLNRREEAEKREQRARNLSAESVASAQRRKAKHKSRRRRGKRSHSTTPPRIGRPRKTRRN